MKKYHIEYEDGFKYDVFGIIDYIENVLSDPLGARKIAIKIYQKCESLATFPKGSKVRHIDKVEKELRFAHIKNYNIVYYVDDSVSTVYIRAVINARRNIASILKDRNSGSE